MISFNLLSVGYNCAAFKNLTNFTPTLTKASFKMICNYFYPILQKFSYTKSM